MFSRDLCVIEMTLTFKHSLRLVPTQHQAPSDGTKHVDMLAFTMRAHIIRRTSVHQHCDIIRKHQPRGSKHAQRWCIPQE